MILLLLYSNLICSLAIHFNISSKFISVLAYILLLVIILPESLHKMLLHGTAEIWTQFDLLIVVWNTHSSLLQDFYKILSWWLIVLWCLLHYYLEWKRKVLIRVGEGCITIYGTVVTHRKQCLYVTGHSVLWQGMSCTADLDHCGFLILPSFLLQ